MKKKRSFNVLTLPAFIPRPNFLEIIQKEKPTGILWGGWFLWNTVLVLVLSIFISFFLKDVGKEVKADLWPQVPEFNFVFENNQLVETGLENPFRFDFEDEFDEGVFLIDIEGTSYDESSLEVFDNAVLIGKDSAIVKENRRNRVQTIYFNEIDELQSLTFDKTKAGSLIDSIGPQVLLYLSLFIFGALWFLFTVMRLIGVAFMSLIFWVMGRIARVKNIGYADCFLATLGLSFIPSLIGIGLLAVGIFPALYSFLLSLILFGMNLYRLPKTRKKKS